MNNILTEEEIANISVDCALVSPSDVCFARKIESAILAKLAEGQEEVAWMFQHEDTGLIQCVDTQQVEWGFERNNPRLTKIAPLYAHPSAELAALRAEVEQLKEGKK